MKNKVILISIIALVVIIALGAVLSKNEPSSARKSEEAPVSDASAKRLFDTAVKLEEKNSWTDAKEMYQQIMANHPDFTNIELVQKNLEDLNLRIIFSQIETPKTVIHEVKSGDSLGKIAKQYNTTVELLKKSNGLSTDIIRVGQRLRIWQGVFSVFVDKSQNILMLRSDGEVVKVYAVSTGKNNNTPIGTFKIVNKLVDPVWYKSGAIVPPESPQNALGSRWLGFDLPGYGIHGTIEPESIGMQVTEGCVRMHNEDVEELFSLLPTGTLVTVVD